MIKIGVITGVQGVNGKLFIRSDSDIKIDTKIIQTVEIGFSEKYSKAYNVNSLEKYNKGYLLNLKDIKTKEQAEIFKEQAVFIAEDFIINKKIIINTSEIIGYKVYNDETMEKIGVIIDILPMPANDLLVVKSSTQEVLIPYINEYISSIDDVSAKMYITVIPGLLEINDKEIFREYYE